MLLGFLKVVGVMKRSFGKSFSLDTIGGSEVSQISCHPFVFCNEKK